jgi:hypothetical protein
MIPAIQMNCQKSQASPVFLGSYSNSRSGGRIWRSMADAGNSCRTMSALSLFLAIFYPACHLKRSRPSVRMSALSGPRGAALDFSREDSTNGRAAPQASPAWKTKAAAAKRTVQTQNPLGREKPTATRSVHDVSNIAYNFCGIDVIPATA